MRLKKLAVMVAGVMASMGYATTYTNANLSGGNLILAPAQIGPNTGSDVIDGVSANYVELNLLGPSETQAFTIQNSSIADVLAFEMDNLQIDNLTVTGTFSSGYGGFSVNSPSVFNAIDTWNTANGSLHDSLFGSWTSSRDTIQLYGTTYGDSIIGEMAANGNGHLQSNTNLWLYDTSSVGSVTDIRRLAMNDSSHIDTVQLARNGYTNIQENATVNTIRAMGDAQIYFGYTTLGPNDYAVRGSAGQSSITFEANNIMGDPAQHVPMPTGYPAYGYLFSVVTDNTDPLSNNSSKGSFGGDGVYTNMMVHADGVGSTAIELVGSGWNWDMRTFDNYYGYSIWDPILHQRNSKLVEVTNGATFLKVSANNSNITLSDGVDAYHDANLIIGGDGNSVYVEDTLYTGTIDVVGSNAWLEVLAGSNVKVSSTDSSNTLSIPGAWSGLQTVVLGNTAFIPSNVQVDSDLSAWQGTVQMRGTQLSGAPEIRVYDNYAAGDLHWQQTHFDFQNIDLRLNREATPSTSYNFAPANVYMGNVLFHSPVTENIIDMGPGFSTRLTMANLGLGGDPAMGASFQGIGVDLAAQEAEQIIVLGTVTGTYRLYLDVTGGQPAVNSDILLLNAVNDLDQSDETVVLAGPNFTPLAGLYTLTGNPYVWDLTHKAGGYYLTSVGASSGGGSGLIVRPQIAMDVVDGAMSSGWLGSSVAGSARARWSHPLTASADQDTWAQYVYRSQEQDISAGYGYKATMKGFDIGHDIVGGATRAGVMVGYRSVASHLDAQGISAWNGSIAESNLTAMWLGGYVHSESNNTDIDALLYTGRGRTHHDGFDQNNRSNQGWIGGISAEVGHRWGSLRPYMGVNYYTSDIGTRQNMGEVYTGIDMRWSHADWDFTVGPRVYHNLHPQKTVKADGVDVAVAHRTTDVGLNLNISQTSSKGDRWYLQVEGDKLKAGQAWNITLGGSIVF